MNEQVIPDVERAIRRVIEICPVKIEVQEVSTDGKGLELVIVHHSRDEIPYAIKFEEDRK